MITQTLRASRFYLRRHPWLKGAIARTGINKPVRRAYERRLLNHGVTDITLLGQRLRFSINSLREIGRIETMSFEEPFVRRMLAAIQPDDVVFDVGANIGVISLLIATGNTKPAAVHAFEPEPRNAAALRRNVSLNNVDNRVTVHELALADREETATLHVGGETGDGSHSLMDHYATDRQAISINLTTTATFTQKQGVTPTFVKIDVEGAEMQVLRGMEPLLRDQSIREIFMEVHPNWLGDGLDEHSVEQWLRERGYQCIWSEKRQSEVHQHYARTEANI